jgi:hypothetical protein
MANLSSLAPIATAAGALSNLVLVTPQQTIGYQPQNPPNTNGTPVQQPPTLVFNYEGEQTVTLESDITDHYVEDNTAIQDQIALRPEVVTTHGFIGELTDISPPALQPLKTIADKLTIVGAYTPALSTTALIAYNQAFQLYQIGQNAAHAAVAAWASVSGQAGTGESVISGNFNFPIGLEPNQNKQQTMFQQFYGYWVNRTLFTVQTPWAIFQNMAIRSLRAIQDAETRMITDFEISFKLMRFASTNIVPAIGVNQQGRLAFQAGGPTNLGTSTPPASIGLGQGLSQQAGVP